MKFIKKNYLWIIIGLIIIGGSYYWYSKSKTTATAVQYKTAVAEKGTLLVTVTGTGQLEAQSQVDLKPVVAGDAIDVKNVYVKNDQGVKKGQMIALLDTEEAQKAIRNAELDLNSAKNKYSEIKDDDASDKYDKKAQKITIEQKENSLNDAKEKLQDYYIRAPFDGIVTGLSVEAGDSVSRTDILASVITKNIIAKISLNEVDAVDVKVEDKVTLKIDALSEISFTGKVSKIDTIGTVSQGVTSYGAEIELDNQNELLKPGMNVSASIATASKADVILIPSGAIKNQNDESYVEVLNNGQIPKKTTIKVGLTNSTQTEVISGINIGDKIVTQTISATAKTTTASNQNSSLRIPGIGGGH
ncbi:MAG: efflux RND transporter periplasmic adaptor subunit [bacterium]|nr:efflux RND transporter periplasmic adaptor subunit [bacterium]